MTLHLQYRYHRTCRSQENYVEKEPIEELYIEVSPEFVGAVSRELGTRRAEMRGQELTSSDITRIDYLLVQELKSMPG